MSTIANTDSIDISRTIGTASSTTARRSGTRVKSCSEPRIASRIVAHADAGGAGACGAARGATSGAAGALVDCSLTGAGVYATDRARACSELQEEVRDRRSGEARDRVGAVVWAPVDRIAGVATLIGDAGRRVGRGGGGRAVVEGDDAIARHLAGGEVDAARRGGVHHAV